MEAPESRESVVARLRSFLGEVLSDAVSAGAEDGANVLVVSHGGTLNTLLVDVLGLLPERTAIPNCSITTCTVEVPDGDVDAFRAALEKLADTAHLAEGREAEVGPGDAEAATA